MMRISRRAHFRPKQPRGPAPNGWAGPANGSYLSSPRFSFVSHLSGLNEEISDGSHEPALFLASWLLALHRDSSTSIGSVSFPAPLFIRNTSVLLGMGWPRICVSTAATRMAATAPMLHPILRTVFTTEPSTESAFQQVVLRHTEPSVYVEQALSGLEISDMFNRQSGSPFPQNQPPHRLTLYHGIGTVYALLEINHTAVDARTMRVIWDQVGQEHSHQGTIGKGKKFSTYVACSSSGRRRCGSTGGHTLPEHSPAFCLEIQSFQMGSTRPRARKYPSRTPVLSMRSVKPTE